MVNNSKEKISWDAYQPQSDDNAYLGLSIEDKFINLGRGPCHGGFQLYSVGNALRPHAKPVLKEAWTKRMMLQDEASEKLADTYYTWLIKESPFSEAFIEKDYEVCKKHGFNLRVDLPSDYVASAAIATRFLTERHGGSEVWVKKRIPLYERLVNDKMDLLWAFVLANMYAPSGKGYSFQMIDGHEMLPSSLTINGLNRFVKGNYLKDSKTFAEAKGYISVGTAWVPRTAGQDTSPTLKVIAKNLHFMAKDYKDFNVFRKPDVYAGYPIIPYKDFPLVVEKLKELINEKAAA